MSYSFSDRLNPDYSNNVNAFNGSLEYLLNNPVDTSRAPQSPSKKVKVQVNPKRQAKLDRDIFELSKKLEGDFVATSNNYDNGVNVFKGLNPLKDVSNVFNPIQIPRDREIEITMLIENWRAKNCK